MTGLRIEKDSTQAIALLIRRCIGVVTAELEKPDQSIYRYVVRLV
jgi:hypothetical protein